MTALCSGGTSSPKPGYGASVALTASGIGALLNNIPTVWAVPLAAYIGLITYNLSTFCTVDPPAVPVITAADFIAVISIADPVAHIAALQKFQQLVGAFAWFNLCQCDTVATPAPPAAPAAPAAVPTVNPVQLTGPNPNALPCITYDSGLITTTLNGGIQFGKVFMGFTCVGMAVPPSGAGTIRATATWIGTNAPAGWQINSNTTESCAGMTILASDTTAWVSGTPKTLTFTGTLANFDLVSISKVDTLSQQYRVVIDYFCGGATPGLPQSNCGCVQDAQTIGVMSSVYALLKNIQRFSVPFAYVLGTVHSAVSGTGSTPVSRLIGYQITVTAQPATKRTSPGNPSYIYDLGWISVSDADGMIEEKRLTRTSFLWFPRLGELATSFNFFLQSGVTINWTEVQPEAQP